MKQLKREWDVLEKDRRMTLIREIMHHFQKSKDREIGMIEAEDILDFFLQNLGPDLYRKAIVDTRSIVRQNAENLEIDLDLLIHS